MNKEFDAYFFKLKLTVRTSFRSKCVSVRISKQPSSLLTIICTIALYHCRNIEVHTEGMQAVELLQKTGRHMP